MASNTLSGSGVSPANTKDQLLHIGTGTAGEATVRIGDGTPTVLSFVSGGAKVAGTFESDGDLKFDNVLVTRPVGSGALTVTMPNWGGVLPIDQVAVKAADQTNTTVTAAAVTDFSLALEAGATYVFEIMLLGKSVATTTGLQVRLTGPAAEVDLVCYDMMQPSSTALATTNSSRQYFTALDSNMVNLTAPTANVVFPTIIRGVIRTTTTPSAGLGLSFQSEIATSAVTVMAGSVMRVRRVS